jgi:septal ring factor EnvC (AmiA/AmiB activator)
MKMGFAVMVGQDQLHWSHIPIHSKLLQEIVDMVRAPEDNTPELNEFNGDPVQTQSIAEQTLANLQDDPRKILGIFTMASQHVQEHVAIGGMQVGMEGSAKQVAKMLRDLRPTVKALNLAVATQERQEQAQREKQEREMQDLRDRADQTELEKAKYEIDRKTEVEKYRVDKEDEVARERLAREAQRGEAQDSIAAARAAGDEARRDRETDSRIEAQRQMSRAKINAANAAARFDTVNSITGMDTVSPGDIAEQGPLAYESL